MFKRLVEPDRPIGFEFEGETVRAAEGETVSAALLAHGALAARESAVSGSPRAPYCLIGVCFECLVEIDGRPNRQGCLTPVREGMRVRRQRAAAARPDGGEA